MKTRLKLYVQENVYWTIFRDFFFNRTNIQIVKEIFIFDEEGFHGESTCLESSRPASTKVARRWAQDWALTTYPEQSVWTVPI